MVVSGSRPSRGRSVVVWITAPSRPIPITAAPSASQKFPVVRNTVLPRYAPSMKSSPWAKLTTSMIPKISVRPEATRARIIPVTMPLMTWIRSRSNGIVTLHSQVLVDDRVVPPEVRRGRVVAHHPFLHDVHTARDLEGQSHVLLDEQDRHPVAVEDVDDLVDLGDHAGHQTLGRLVEEDDLGLEHHRPRDREHLLLAARERATRLVAPLPQHREAPVDLREQGVAKVYGSFPVRSEEHTSELQSRQYLVCRLLLEKKKTRLSRHRLGNFRYQQISYVLLAHSLES